MTIASTPSSAPDPEALLERFRYVRGVTEELSAPLSAEDQLVQAMPAASPVKWHRAHTTWFFETFLLIPAGFAPFDASFSRLFNSYYVSVGPRHHRPHRGLLSRPDAAVVGEYRRVVDERIAELVRRQGSAGLIELAPLLLLGLAHEEQHQELILTDFKSALALHPLRPAAYASRPPAPPSVAASLTFRRFEGGLGTLGRDLGEGFAFDNETPAHRVFVEPFELANRLVTVGEWLAFFQAKGYEEPLLWLSDGFDWVQREAIDGPAYLRVEGGEVVVFDHYGERVADPDEPITHLSFYEADAVARFLGARLPTEAEWEHAAARSDVPEHGYNLRESRHYRALPTEPSAERELTQLYGDAWEWTQSAYAPYPGYRPARGALGEYNGKFMANQLVLRGGSCLTPRGHVRPTYRNFWYPDTQFQMTGVRLCRAPKEGDG